MTKKKLTYIKTEKLIPYARNSRTHDDAQISQIMASINEFGFTNPLLVDGDNQIIAGHGRLLSAQRLGMDEVPCLVLDHLTEAQQKALVIADNKLALNAGWDNELLAIELKELGELDFDLSLTGFGDDELAAFMVDKTEGLTDEDAVPEAPVNPVTVEGDVWVLGNHRLMCGDSTSIDAVEKLMDGQKADFLFTSPPYGQQRNYEKEIENWEKLMCDVFSIAPVKHGAQILVNLGLIHDKGEWEPYWNDWLDAMRCMDWKRFAMYVWDQGPGLPGDWNGRLAPSFELIFHFCKTPKKAYKTKKSKHAGSANHGTGMRKADGTVGGYSHVGKSVQSHKIPDNVIRVMRHKARGEECKHPAVFPVQLPIELMEPYTKEGDICFEPFTGSGTQIISAEKTSRYCYGMELSPTYCDIAIKRWQDFTGKQAVHEDGRLFDDMAKTQEAAE